MTALLRSEALKLRSLRVTLVLTALMLLISAVVGFAMVRIAATDGTAVDLSRVALGPSQAAWFLAVVVAVVATAGEFGHRTVRTTLLQHPRRVPVLVAKGAVAAAYGAALTLASTAVALAAGAVTLGVTDVEVEVAASGASGWWPVLGSVVVGGLWGVMATGLGTLTRNTTIAVVAVLLWKLVLEAILPIVTRRPEIVAWLPGGAADSVTGLGGEHRLGAWAGGGVFAAYALAAVVAAAWVLVRRDPA